ncbi:hypothetical protein CAPTEDRAFT_188944 [Capitella teleta]|uniref:Apextrin C-terminal domain-containing protein n=1 Tax=Capitella teleta TaxID=283909 RepID=R7UAL6_CAPTE|nr:hypothetical protein CAPTEDRAFT_188944 [Capitella teleta]|eukprot:ELU03395.1 hypothetical protein CAPTEDRAFT_188944 [Capitella teleta]
MLRKPVQTFEEAGDAAIFDDRMAIRVDCGGAVPCGSGQGQCVQSSCCPNQNYIDACASGHVCCLGESDCDRQAKQGGTHLTIYVQIMLKATLSAHSLWPQRDFALPMTSYGCPKQPNFPWLEGQVTFRAYRVHLSEDFAFMGPLKNNAWSLRFCTKMEHSLSPQNSERQTVWPAGKIHNGISQVATFAGPRIQLFPGQY